MRRAAPAAREFSAGRGFRASFSGRAAGARAFAPPAFGAISRAQFRGDFARYFARPPAPLARPRAPRSRPRARCHTARAADLAPQDLTVAWETARIAVSRMQPHAERALDHALQLGADPAGVAFLRGLLASRQLDMSTARAAWSQAPQNGSRWADLCRIYLLDQSAPGSLTPHVLPLLERYPEDPHLVGLAAINLTYDRRADEAIALTDRTLVLTSFLNYEPFLRGLAARIAALTSSPSPNPDELNQLLVQFNMIRAITRDPDARSSVATHLVRHNIRLGYADLLLGEALEVAPESPDIWLMFSLLRIRQRRQQAALEGLRRARELHPNPGNFPSYIHDAFRDAFGDTSPLQALERP